jgi:hypothetical protein
MITVDCRDIEAIRNDLLVYVSDNLGAIPALKPHKFVLSDIDDDADEPINISKVINLINEYLESINESRNFNVVPSQPDYIMIKSTTGKMLERDMNGHGGTKSAEMFTCFHCGFVTRYEVEYNAHKSTHYL